MSSAENGLPVKIHGRKLVSENLMRTTNVITKVIDKPKRINDSNFSKL